MQPIQKYELLFFLFVIFLSKFVVQICVFDKGYQVMHKKKTKPPVIKNQKTFFAINRTKISTLKQDKKVEWNYVLIFEKIILE